RLPSLEVSEHPLEVHFHPLAVHLRPLAVHLRPLAVHFRPLDGRSVNAMFTNTGSMFASIG
ncbi:MAG TPA: hypothetical protein VEX38_05155, partial [Fimbriimonadaceae bacterium]|nr:hypothetical protein [Fimbriimonadaceae bacterium]